MSFTYGLMLFCAAAFGMVLGIFTTCLMKMASMKPTSDEEGCPYKTEPMMWPSIQPGRD